MIYPQYIDSSIPRSRGRRIPRNIAIPKPRIEEIIEAAEELGLNPKYEESAYPKHWWIKGRIVVDKVGSKLNTLKLIAQKIKDLRK